MTREEAIELAGETVDNLESVSLVMDIYDDLEAMTCENCKHAGCGYMTAIENDIGFNPDGWGCNKWLANDSK